MTESDRYADWVPGALLVLPRLYLGLVFAVAAWAKLSAPQGFPLVLSGFLSNVALSNGFGWYRPLVASVILPHVEVFAVLVLAAELFVAIGMLLGLLTRVAAVVAIVLLLNYACAKGLPLWSPASNDAADIVLAIVVLIGSAGRSVGLDARLARRGR